MEKTDLDFYSIIEVYTRYYSEIGFEKINSYPLSHPSFKTSFILSAGVLEIDKILSGEISEPFYKIITQPCFRYFDTFNNDNIHFSLFLMGASLYFNSPTRQKVLTNNLNFLINEIKLPVERLFISIFRGEKVFNSYVDRESEIFDTWISLGCNEKNIYWGNSNSNFWNEGRNSGDNRSGICGTSTEIFYDLRETTDNETLFNPMQPQFLEIANIVFPEYKIINGELIKLRPKIAEVAIGFERLAMLTENRNDIYRLSHIIDLYSTLLKCNQFNGHNIKGLINDTRTIISIYIENVIPKSKGRGSIYRNLFRRIFLELHMDINLIIDFFSISFCYLKNNPTTIYKNVINSEFNELITIIISEYDLYTKLNRKICQF